jgi:hypothetical protein
MTHWALALTLGWFAASQPAAPQVRLHHVHYRVPDPAAAMNAAAARLGGTRVVVSGLGVGVRAGGEFVLYDRSGEPEASSAAQPDVGEAYAAAFRWLKAHGLAAAPESLAASRIARAPAARCLHIAFAATDYEGVIRQIAAAPVGSTAESTLYDAGGVIVEIVRESELPDAFWCPMHPDVRSGTTGKCPLCGMELVAMPPPRIGEYNLDVALKPGRNGVTAIRLAVREPQSNALVTSFTTVHERELHLFIVSRDLEYFAHVHPDRSADGSFQIEQRLPAGEYMLIADFLPSGATTQMVQKAVIARGERSNTPALPPAVIDPDVRVSLKSENLAAGKDARLTFSVTDAATGEPITDLEPYLGAAAHLLVVRADLGDAMHEQPEEQSAGGPTISFHPLVPAAGEYKLWLQVQRRGRVLTFPFRLRAE